jgi:phosphatidylserine/phosphatidylglycerophosphate/cardiolipin synthase-like enzyme
METRTPAPQSSLEGKPIFRRRRRMRWIRPVAIALVVLWVASASWQRFKPLPDGLSIASPLRAPASVRFLADYTYTDASGERRVEQRIFDRVLELIDGAERLIVMDMFLFNHFAGETGGDDMRALSREVTDALVERRNRFPSLRVIVLSDPINTFYGSLDLPQFARLRRAGVEIVMTDLDRLRASNPLWSGAWRICCQWFGGGDGGSGWLPNPVGDQDVTLRSVLRLLRFKANHRKTLVVDAGQDWRGLVTSGNAHDASSAHSNIAIEFSGAAALDLLASEAAVAAFSAPSMSWPRIEPAPDGQASDGPRVQVLTESKIRDAVLDLLARAGPGDRVDLAMFYLSHRDIVRALLGAHARGAAVRALLDPNKDAFGRVKNGIPNRSVAAEMTRNGVEVRWCDTHGEQCHDKLILARFAGGESELIAGSANFTRRNLDDLNLETDVRVLAATGSTFMRDAARYFERRWNEPGAQNFSVPYSAYADSGTLRYWRYRLMEATGLSTF